MTSRLDVFGIGSPLVDLLAHVPEAFLVQKKLEKNRMYLVDLPHQQDLLYRLMAERSQIIFASGGSCANTMQGISQLGGQAAFCGKIADDDHGQIYEERLQRSGVKSYLSRGSEGVTGSCLVLVTPDAARTLNTHLGISQQFHYSDIPAEAIQAAQYLYVEGYLWDTENQKEAVLKAIEYAQAHQVKVSLSLSDPFCVNRHRDDFQKLLRESVDLVFCNQEEAFALTQTHISQEALRQLGESVETVAMTLGAHGALIGHQGQVSYIDPVPVKVMDTTGAGDAFAAGLLYGLTQGKSYLESGRIAAFLASQVIGQMGARCESDVRGQLNAFLSASA